MRNEYQQQLDMVDSDLVTMTRHVRNSLRRGTDALLAADATEAEDVIAGDAVIDEMRERLEEESFELILRQAPVATDLRQLVSALRMVADLERMGDLSVHVAKIARMRYPTVAVPEVLTETIKRMASTADHMLETTGYIIESRDVSVAESLEADDDDMDQLRRDMFRVLLADDSSIEVEAAIDMALIGRYYERIGDHAVSMARRVIFLVTGEHPGSAA